MQLAADMQTVCSAKVYIFFPHTEVNAHFLKTTALQKRIPLAL